MQAECYEHCLGIYLLGVWQDTSRTSDWPPFHKLEIGNKEIK